MTTDIVLLAGWQRRREDRHSAESRYACSRSRRSRSADGRLQPASDADHPRGCRRAPPPLRRAGVHLLFDIDRFKDINDALGHAEGDRVLTSLVALVGQRMRKLDALFRMGGEEFVAAPFGNQVQRCIVRRRRLAHARPRRRVSSPAGLCRSASASSSSPASSPLPNGLRRPTRRSIARNAPGGTVWLAGTGVHHGHRRAGCPQPDALSAAHLVIEIGRALEPRSRPHESFVSLKELAPPIPT